MPAVQQPTGHVFRLDRVRGPVWYAKYRLPDGRQVQKKIGPAWTERGRPPAGHVTKRLAEAWLRNVLDQARRGTLPGMVRTGATFADAAAEFLRYVADERDCKPSTLRDYRSVARHQRGRPTSGRASCCARLRGSRPSTCPTCRRRCVGWMPYSRARRTAR